MKFEKENITITTEENLSEEDKLFLSFMTGLISKGLKNPLIQLNVFTLVTTGKTFIELLNSDVSKADLVIATFKSLAKGLSNLLEKTEISDLTIEDILRGKQSL